MRLIPPQLINCKSDAERLVFSFLGQINLGGADTALHSLNIGRHEYKRWGEADFLLVGKRGILLLEVKGGRVACNNGFWEFTSRFDKVETKRESPAAQASSAFFSLEKNYLRERFGRELAGIPAGWGVVFPNIPRLTGKGSSDLPEHPDEITAYDVDCKGHNSFKAYLERAFGYWESKRNKPRQMPPDLAGRIVRALRPNFERVPTLNSQLRHVERDLCQFTDEQYERMDEIADNDRILISGGAGTGKTFVAAACARYEAAAGRDVLLVTRSPFLASFLASHDLPANVTVATIEALAGIEHGQWDTLIVDEGQDLCDAGSLTLLGSVLKGGLEKGRWRWFGDPNHQVSPSYPLDEDCYQYLRELAVRQQLKQNVRNAGRVIEAISIFSGVDVGKPRGEPGGGKVVFEQASRPEEQDAVVVKALKDWLGGEGAAARNEVVVLVDDTRDPPAYAAKLTAKGFRAEALSERALGKSPRDCVLVARIEDFKGLERPLVCIAGLGRDAASMGSQAYKALSRANHELVLVAPAQEIQVLADDVAARAMAREN